MNLVVYCMGASNVSVCLLCFFFLLQELIASVFVEKASLRVHSVVASGV